MTGTFSARHPPYEQNTSLQARILDLRTQRYLRDCVFLLRFESQVHVISGLYIVPPKVMNMISDAFHSRLSQELLSFFLSIFFILRQTRFPAFYQYHRYIRSFFLSLLLSLNSLS